MDQVYGSRDLDWLSAHGGLTTLGRPGHSGAQKVIMIARREREEVIRVLTIGTTWRHNCRDDHTTALNRGDRWCSDGEMVLGVRRRQWSRGECVG
jgi:hypothetical protein